MALYAVYCPKGTTPEDAPERLRFVPERPSLWAFLLPPLWLLVRRLWLAFVFWFAAFLAVTAVVTLMNAEAAVLAYLMFCVWFALSARDLEQWSLSRAGWTLEAVVDGRDREAAERRFFEALTATPPAPPRAGRVAALGTGGGGIVGFEAFGGAAR